MIEDHCPADLNDMKIRVVKIEAALAVEVEYLRELAQYIEDVIKV